ncbi:LON peptidase substrate-binding domain-containing protein [Chelativorans sp.]|uniref:LON peptidase substrate-binding domain-containing protein n=1 Tax=Chelativorans sp. TaxID=2203393 RepID=UPI0028114157|nr:LON peptidase substrate-binding domain-containing protein [Chelativorans sp.]
MKAGNAHYRDISDLPEVVPVFPLAGALLLPGSRLPLNIFEPRYVSMIDQALAGRRIIGMIQPRLNLPHSEAGAAAPELAGMGCIGRLVSMAETGDGRYLVALEGICRFRVGEELPLGTAFRQCRILPIAADLQEDRSAGKIDRAKLLRTLRAYLDANELTADWQSFLRAENDVLVNGLSMMAPYGAAEKQALLEAPDLLARAETLIAITEMVLAGGKGDSDQTLQ